VVYVSSIYKYAHLLLYKISKLVCSQSMQCMPHVHTNNKHSNANLSYTAHFTGCAVCCTQTLLKAQHVNVCDYNV